MEWASSFLFFLLPFLNQSGYPDSEFTKVIKRIIFFSCYFSMSLAFGQNLEKDTIKLKEVKITSNRLENFSQGTKVQEIDSATKSQFFSGNLSDLLINESPLFIKSYGVGSLATSSFRGGSANHTAILWNGFNISSPTNGLTDLSLIPNMLANNIRIQYGGTSSLWGSGAVGGTIHLNNEVQFDKGITALLNLSAGSFDNFEQIIQAEISKKNWVSSIKAVNLTAKNDFSFYNTYLPDTPLVTQSNASLKQKGLLAENYFRINENQKINLRFWYQDNDRKIPPTMLQTRNKSSQKDETIRITSEWQRTGEKASYFIRGAYFDEYLLYSSGFANYLSENKSKTIIGEAETKIKAGKNITLNSGINNTYSEAFSDGYFKGAKQNRTTLFSSFKFMTPEGKFNVSLSARQEFSTNQFIPFTYSLGTDYNLLKWISMKANISKVYRNPTFNDLYWTPGGNPELLPESGYSKEAGLKLKWWSSNNKIGLETEPTVFHRNINNWIIWLPGPGYWTPQNLMKVFSRGMETRNAITFRNKNLVLKLEVLTNYVVSTNEQVKTENDASVGKQLIYVPMYSGHGKIYVSFKGFSLTYIQTYTGYRYTTTDNRDYLFPFSLSNIYLSKKLELKKTQLVLFGRANNNFNEQYQVISSRAMPLRNYQAGISLQFNHPNSIK